MQNAISFRRFGENNNKKKVSFIFLVLTVFLIDIFINDKERLLEEKNY